ncbi:MAG: hypothetical protein ACOX8W_09895 [bacterium]|jgi:F0F1-type ATP synthase epsilon subunit
MSKLFDLTIITPEAPPRHESVEALTLPTSTGEITILAGHMPLIAEVIAGTLRYRQNGAWESAHCKEGFLRIKDGAARLILRRAM